MGLHGQSNCCHYNFVHIWMYITAKAFGNCISIWYFFDFFSTHVSIDNPKPDSFSCMLEDDFPDPKPSWVGRMSLLTLPRCHMPFWLLNLNPSPKRGVDWTCSTLLKKTKRPNRLLQTRDPTKRASLPYKSHHNLAIKFFRSSTSKTHGFN